VFLKTSVVQSPFDLLAPHMHVNVPEELQDDHKVPLPLKPTCTALHVDRWPRYYTFCVCVYVCTCACVYVCICVLVPIHTCWYTCNVSGVWVQGCVRDRETERCMRVCMC